MAKKEELEFWLQTAKMEYVYLVRIPLFSQNTFSDVDSCAPLSLLSSSFKLLMSSLFSFSSSRQLASLALYEKHFGQSSTCADLVSRAAGDARLVLSSPAGAFK